MSALTTDTTLFGARGVSDMETYNPANIAIKRTIDFGVATATASTYYEFIPVPKAFVLSGVALRQTEVASGDVAVNVFQKSDGTSAISTITVSDDDTALADPVYTTKALSLMSGDMLCVQAAAALTKGKVEVTVFGYSPFGNDPFNGVDTPALRAKLQTEDNVSGGSLDPRKYEGV